MKKLTTLLLAAGLVVSSFTNVSASTFKPNLLLNELYSFRSVGEGFTGNLPTPVSTTNFKAVHCIDLGFLYTANENLSARFMMRVVSSNDRMYGVEYGAGEFDSAYANSLGVRLAYIDWNIPTTDVLVRMGYQTPALPDLTGLGNVLFDFPTSRVSGITVAAPINENIKVNGMWFRLNGTDMTGTSSGHHYFDMYGVSADFHYEGFRVAPYAFYGQKGSGTDSIQSTSALYDVGFSYYFPAGTDDGAVKADLFYVGGGFELSMFDPFTFAVDALYNNISFDRSSTGVAVTQDGFYVAGVASYKTNNGTPNFKAWYATGVDEYDESNPGGLLLPAPNFRASTILFGAFHRPGGGDVMLASHASPQSTWGAVLEWKDFSFINKLKHTARIMYMEGTSDLKAGSSTSFSKGMIDNDDSFIEVDFDSTYQIYKNLAMVLELGYVKGNFDHITVDSSQENIYRAAVNFTYFF